MNKRVLRILLLALPIALLGAGVALANGDDPTIDWWVIAGGGGPSSAGDVSLNDTLGQPVIGASSGESGFVLTGGFWAGGPAGSLAVTLASFAAQGQADRVVVTWETVSELDNAGFNLYRGLQADGSDRALLTYVASQAPGSTLGAAYSYEDLAVQPGETWWYWLEDVDLSGATTLHGPVSATVQTPTAVTLASVSASPAAAPAGAALPWLLAVVGAACSRAMRGTATTIWRRLRTAA